MSRKPTGTLITLGIVILLAGTSTIATAQTADSQSGTHQHEHDQMQDETAQGTAEPTTHCQRMQEKKAEMHAKQKKIQAELDRLVAQMNSTTGESQQAFIAELLTKLVENRKHMAGMMQMDPEMMKEMMSGHMADCPMMNKSHAKTAGEASPTDASDHSQHH